MNTKQFSAEIWVLMLVTLIDVTILFTIHRDLNQSHGTFKIIYTQLLVVVSQAHHCTNTQVALCRKERDDYMKNLTNSTEVNFNLLQMPEQHLEIYCRYYNNTIKACFADLRQHCSDDVKVTFIGYEDSTTYLCNENYAGFLNVKGCLSRSSALTEMVICKVQYDSRKEIIRNNAEEFCRATETFKQCNADVVRLHCNSEAVEWIKTFNDRIYQAEMEYNQCPTTTTSTTTTTTTSTTGTTVITTSVDNVNQGSMETWLIAVIAVGILVVLLVIIITAVVIVCRNSKDDNETIRRDDSTNVVVNVVSGYHEPRDRYKQRNYQRQHSGSRHGSSGSVHSSSGHLPRYKDPRYIEGDRKKTKEKKHATKANINKLSSEYLEPARYTAGPELNFVNRPPSLSEISKSGSSKDGRSLSRYPSNDGSEYTQLTSRNDTSSQSSVVGYQNNTYEELPN